MSELVLESNLNELSISTSVNNDDKNDDNNDDKNDDNNDDNNDDKNVLNIDSKPNEKLGDRMKKYEAKMDIRILPYESFVLRLDGRSFSNFTKKFKKPFDDVFVKAMCKTMIDLVEKFEIQTGYTHSDEITLVFNSRCSREQFELFLLGQIDKSKIKIHLFDGRIQKILTLLSSYCSVRFNYHLNELINPIKDRYDLGFVSLIKSYQQMFDARVLKFDEHNKYEILNHQIWRSIHDCERNAILTYAYTHFGPKHIMNKNCSEQIKMLEEKNIFWSKDIPMFIKHGIYCKKILVEKEIGENKVLRSEYICKQFKINFSEDNLNMLLDKYWINTDDRLDIDNLTL